MTHMNIHLKEMWQQMRDAEQVKGFNLTVRDLCAVWDVGSTNTVIYRLEVLMRYGFVTSLKVGPKKRIYKTVDENQIRVLQNSPQMGIM